MGASKRALIYSPPLLSASHRKTHLLVTAGAGHGWETRWQGISRKVQKKTELSPVGIFNIRFADGFMETGLVWTLRNPL